MPKAVRDIVRRSDVQHAQTNKEPLLQETTEIAPES